MKLKEFLLPIALFFIFSAIAIALWLTTGKLFYLFNFLYIGGFVSAGTALSVAGFRHSRLVVQLGVGLYMLLYLGLMQRENMQLEGFFYYLFLGLFQAAVIHYFVAKIAGPVLFGRGWCGYACWTAAVFDFLPYKSGGPRIKKLSGIRYIMFAASLCLVASLFLFESADIGATMFLLFVAGNIFYYITGIVLAFKLKDNRAFCKYICPVTVFLKPASYFSLLRVKVNEDKCIGCGKCKRVCPMNVDITDAKRNRENGTECILCFECIKACPEKAVKI